MNAAFIHPANGMSLLTEKIKIIGCAAVGELGNESNISEVRQCPGEEMFQGMVNGCVISFFFVCDPEC